MTTAHRPTFDPARGKETLRGPAYHQRLLPAHTQLKFRKAGQGGTADKEARDLRAELLVAEAAHLAKRNGGRAPPTEDDDDDDDDDDDEKNHPAAPKGAKRALEAGSSSGDEQDTEAKRRRILEESRDIDADDSDSPSGSDDEDGDDGSDSDDDSDDEDAELQRELERVKRERQEKREREERDRAAAEAEERERDIARGNPLLNNNTSNTTRPDDFTVKRRWDDDVVFKNQARGTEDKGKAKEFVNDTLRSDFHRRFMSKYVR